MRTLPRNLPPGRTALVAILMGAIAPMGGRKLKPVAKALGKGMIRLGKRIRDAAEEPHDPRKTQRESRVEQEERNR